MASVPGSTVPVEPVQPPPPPPDVQDPNKPKPEVYGPPAPGTSGAPPTGTPAPNTTSNNPADISAANHPPETLKDWKSPPTEVVVAPNTQTGPTFHQEKIQPDMVLMDKGYVTREEYNLYFKPTPDGSLTDFSSMPTQFVQGQPDNWWTSSTRAAGEFWEGLVNGRPGAAGGLQVDFSRATDYQIMSAASMTDAQRVGVNLRETVNLFVPFGQPVTDAAARVDLANNPYKEEIYGRTSDQAAWSAGIGLGLQLLPFIGSKILGAGPKPVPVEVMPSTPKPPTAPVGELPGPTIDVPYSVVPDSPSGTTPTGRSITGAPELPPGTPGGPLLKPTPEDAIRSTLVWLGDQPKTPGASADLVAAGNKVNQLLGGRTASSLTDRQATDLYRSLTNSQEGAALSNNQTYMEQLSNRFSSPLSRRDARVAQLQFDQVRAQLSAGDPKASTRALSRVDIEVNGNVTGQSYKDRFFTTSGKLSLNQLPPGMHSTKTVDVVISDRIQQPGQPTVPQQTVTVHEAPLHPTYRAPNNARVFEAEAAAFQQVEETLGKLEDSGVLLRDSNGNIDARGVKVNITLDRISCPSCGAGTPSWLSDIRAAYPNIDININYLPKPGE